MSDKQYAVNGLGDFGLSVSQRAAKFRGTGTAVDIGWKSEWKKQRLCFHKRLLRTARVYTVKELRLDDYDMVMVSIGFRR